MHSSTRFRITRVIRTFNSSLFEYSVAYTIIFTSTTCLFNNTFTGHIYREVSGVVYAIRGSANRHAEIAVHSQRLRVRCGQRGSVSFRCIGDNTKERGGVCARDSLSAGSARVLPRDYFTVYKFTSCALGVHK